MRVLTKEERNTILAALRMFQIKRPALERRANDGNTQAVSIWMIATDGDSLPLDEQQIDDLIRSD